MPRLIDHEPKWVDHGDRRGLGLLMTSPVNPKWRILVLFTNPLDGGPPWPGESRELALLLFPDPEWPGDKDDAGRWVMGCGTVRWQRTGETFEVLSLHPSVNAHNMGHFTIAGGGW